MFRGALSPHRQPLLDEAQAPTPPKKPAASSLRNLFFGKDDAQPHNDPSDEQHAQRNVGSTRARTPSQASNKIAPDAVTAMAGVTSPPPKRNNPRDTFQRTKSQPIRLDASAALSASRAFDPSMSRAAALDPGSFQSQSQRSPGPPQRTSPTTPQTPRAFEPPSLRSTVYGSCSHVLSTVMSVLVQTIKTHREYMDATLVAQASPDVSAAPLDNNTVRKAKLLYIALLEKAQKERGEWQGFGTAESNGKKERASSNNNEEEEEHHSEDNDNEESDARTPDESAKGLLLASLRDCTKEESFAVLNELLELSFRNLRVALVSPAAYSKHRHALETQSLSCPASLETLLRIGAFVSDLSRDEKRCLLHLLGFWSALCVVDPTRQELKRIVEEKHALVLSESSEMEFMQHAARKSGWSDLVAIDVLIIMAQYREMIFSDLEFYTIRQEMQIAPLDPEPEVTASQPPSETNSASPEIEMPEEPEEDALDDSPPSPLESFEGEPSMIEVLEEEPPAPEANGDDVETRPASPVADEDDMAADISTPPPQEPSSPKDDTRRGSLVPTQPSSTPQIPLDDKPTAPTSTTAHAAITSPASTPASNKIKSPRAKGPKPRQYAATVVSPRFKRSRLVYPSIHAAAAAVTPRQRRAGGVGAMPVDEVLPYVAVALAAASIGVLATVAFFAVRKPAH